MTEAEWLGCTEPHKMLEYLGGGASERKLRLFAAACCRRLWRYPLETGDEHKAWAASVRDAVGLGERHADGQATPEELDAAALCSASGIEAADAFLGCAGPAGELADVPRYAVDAVGELAFYEAAQDPSLGAAEYSRVVDAAQQAERSAQADLLRDLFGNPFRPVTLAPSWLTPDVRRLAQATYEERLLPSGELEPARLAVLADALEDAGCGSAEILGHLRAEGVHVRGCWAVDLVLGKE
jgi:hypothetical protein